MGSGERGSGGKEGFLVLYMARGGMRPTIPWYPMLPAPWDAGREQRDHDSAPMRASFLPAPPAQASDVLFATKLWGPSGSSWKSKRKNNILGLPRRGASRLAGREGGIWGAEGTEVGALEGGHGSGLQHELS